MSFKSLAIMTNRETSANRVLAVGDRMASYHWFEYHGKTLNLENKNGVKVTIKTGEPIGMRQNPTSKYFFMVVMKVGPKTVFRLSADTAETISKACKAI